MSNDEKDLGVSATIAATPRNNIIHVNFCGSKRKPPERRPTGALNPTLVARFPERRASTLALSAPWIVRLVALIGIVVLSLLVL